MYFSKLPDMLYSLPVNGRETTFVVKDITANSRILNEVINNISLYDEYDIIDGESPETISTKVYGSPKYHWILMIANGKYDYSTDFPLDYLRLMAYVVSKYGEENVNNIHHYENENGLWVSDNYPSARPISNLTHEENINESKRRIRIISKQLVQQISNELEGMFRT